MKVGHWLLRIESSQVSVRTTGRPRQLGAGAKLYPLMRYQWFTAKRILPILQNHDQFVHSEISK
jgi:hypothetical protein